MFLGQLRHAHLVKLIGYCCVDEHRLLVYEYMPRGSLENQLFRSKLSEVSLQNFHFQETMISVTNFMFDFLVYRVFSITAMVNQNEDCSWSCKGSCFPT